MTKEWAVLPTIRAEMPFQMALDEILLNRAKGNPESSRPILRFYFSAGPWVTAGYSYSPSSRGAKRREIPLQRDFSPVKWRARNDSNSAEKTSGAKICRRITGGGQVLHGKDLIFSLVAAKDHDESFKSVRLSYLKIHEAIKAGLESLGKRPRFYRCDENLPKGEDCFRFPIATDLGIGNEKIAGGAQKRSGGVLLHQESVKLRAGLEAEHLIQAISRGIEKKFGVRLAALDLDPGHMREAAELSRTRYETEAV